MLLWETEYVPYYSHIIGSQVVKSGTGMPLLFFAFLTFLRIPGSLVGRISLLRYSATSPPFPHKSSGGHANHFQGSLYFSFLPAKQRDFPGNVRSGGCDSLPLVVAFTSKQHDSPLSYALHFLHIISHQMCCAGERAECRAHQSVEKSLHLSAKNARKARAVSEEGIRLSRAATSLLSASPAPKLYQKEKKNKVQTSQLCIYQRSMSA